MKLAGGELLEIYEKLLELRYTDERLVSLKLKDLVMNGFHPYAGEEAVAVGVCRWLRREDYVVSTHRPQGHALAKGATPRAIFCEMLGRMGGPSNGVGGPMQWIDSENPFFCGSIVGSGVSYATGFGLAAKREKKGRICACFFGDGASNTGAFHEGMNLAALWKLPIVYICENNQYGEAMPVGSFVPIPEIARRAESYGMKGIRVDGMDALAVADAAHTAVVLARSGDGPSFIEAVTYRFRGHYMGDPENYRTKAEVQEWKARDPIPRLRAHILSSGGHSEAELEALEARTSQRIAEDESWALQQPLPPLSLALGNVIVPVAGKDA